MQYTEIVWILIQENKLQEHIYEKIRNSRHWIFNDIKELLQTFI